MPEGIDAIIVHHLAQNEGQIDAHGFGFGLGQFGSRPRLSRADFLQDYDIGEKLAGEEEVTPACAVPYFRGSLVFLSFWDILGRDEILRFPARSKSGQLLFGSLDRLEVSLGRRAGSATSSGSSHRRFCRSV